MEDFTNNQPQGCDDDNKLAEFDDNIDDQEMDEEDFLGDINGIMQYQHKILRKYAMLGMIKYCAVPYFHKLVTNKDYKMICIFEVFA